MIKARDTKKLSRVSLFLTACVLIVVLLAGTVSVSAATPKVGDKLGDVLYSDITAYINGSAIPTSVIKGKTLVIVEDLARYGFDVVWNSGDKTLKVELSAGKKFNPLPVSANTGAVGAVKGQYVYTDIQTYLSGVVVESFAVGGKTMINFELLKRYGTLDWNNQLKELRLQTTSPTPKVGDKLGDVLYSDITAYINGQAIPTSVIKGKTLVIVEDLARYGFDVAWNSKAKTLKVELNKGKKFNPLSISANTGAVGAVKGQYVYTDIQTYLSGKIVESFAVGGKTMIDFELLKTYGKLDWNNQQKTLGLTVENNAIDLKSITVNGSDTVPTTQLTITFDRAVPNLSYTDFTITGATRGTLTGVGPVYYLTISNITVKDREEITVSVAKKDFTFNPSSQKVIVFNPGYQFTNLTANGNYNTTTTQLTLTFDRAVSLTLNDITVMGATKGALSGSGTTYYLTISDITVATGQNITVSVNKAGYLFNPSSKQVVVYRVPVAFNLSANGSDTATTNQLTLSFDRAVPLSSSDIIVTGATKGSLTQSTSTSSSTVYYLNISNITVSDRGYVSVQINKSGYDFSPVSRDAQVRVLPSVQFTNLEQNGNYSSATTTLTITLNQNITDLTASNISISVPSGRSTNAVTINGSLSRTSSSSNNYKYTLPIVFNNNVSYPIKDGDKLTVTIQKSGTNFSPASMEVTVYNPDTINYSLASNSTTNTTAITITFTAPVPSLQSSDITIYNNGGVATKSSTNPLSSSSNNNMIYTLYVTTSTTGYITVNISKSGYTFNYTNNQVYVYSAFVAVTGISGTVPTTATAGTAVTLPSTVTPSNATYKSITWQVISPGTTGATISGYTLNTTAAGTVTIRATVANGLAVGTAYTPPQDFVIIVNENRNLSIGVASGSSSTISVGGSTQLTAVRTPAAMTVSWYIIDGVEYATIDQSGKVTATSNNTGSSVAVKVGVASTDAGTQLSAEYIIIVLPDETAP